MADKKKAFWLNLWQASNVDHVPPEEKCVQELIPDFDALHAIRKENYAPPMSVSRATVVARRDELHHRAPRLFTASLAH